MLKGIIYYTLLSFCLIILIYSCVNLNNQNKDLDKRIKLNNIYTNINTSSYNYINMVEEYRKRYNNDDIVGIININGLDLSSLIVQGNDNNYYLNHLENKDKSIYGSLMLDYRTDLSNSKINLIYGHMSDSNATPFRKLEKYLDYDFYNANKDIEIIDEYNRYKYQIFSVAKIGKEEYKHLYIDLDDTRYLEQLNYYKDISLYKEDIDLNINDKILILQTCTSHSNHFILVIAKLVTDVL